MWMGLGNYSRWKWIQWVHSEVGVMDIISSIYRSILLPNVVIINLLVTVDRAKLWLISMVESLEKMLIPLVHQVYDRFKHSIHSGSTKGGIGGIFPQLEALPPLDPTVRRKKWQKSAIFGKFLDFCPLREAFCPLDAPTKTFLVSPLTIHD